MDKRIVRPSEDSDRTARHYGRAYQCLRCLYKDGVERVDVKRRIEAHVTKYHLSLDEVGHYCRLCSFRCWDRKTLEDHVRLYARYKRMAGEQGATGLERDFLVSNSEPYVMGAADYLILSKEKSRDFFMRKRSPSPPSTQDEVFDLVREVAQLSGIEETETAASNLVDTLLGDDGSVASEGAAVPRIHPTRSEPGKEKASGISNQQSEPLDLSVPSAPEDDIFGQLFGESDAELTPFVDQPPKARSHRADDLEEPPAKRKRHQTANRRPSRPRSQSRAPSEAVSEASSSSSSSSISAEQWQEIGRAIVKPIHEALEQNTSTVRVMGKTLETLTQAVEVIARSCKGMQMALEEQTRTRRGTSQGSSQDRGYPRRRTEEPRRRNHHLS